MGILHKKLLGISSLLGVLLRSRSKLMTSVKYFPLFDSLCCELFVTHLNYNGRDFSFVTDSFLPDSLGINHLFCHKNAVVSLSNLNI